MQTALINARVLTERGFDSSVAVLMEGEHIVDLIDATKVRSRDIRVINLQGRYLLPGFIDCQVNGGGGVLFNDAPNVTGITRMARAHRRFGTTGLLPTLITDSAEAMRTAIAAVAQAVEQRVPGVLGIHLEGPFLATERKGVHDASKFHDPDAADEALVCSLRSGVTLLTLAPEHVPLATLRRLAARSVVLAAGHTAASYAQVREALDAGLRGFTHLFNAMSPLQSREPGVVGAALDDPETWCGLIADGHHVHPASMRIALAAKPKGKVFLVTDAMPPVGSEDQSFVLNGETIVCRDGVCRTADGVLAGSGLDMATAVRNTVKLLRVGLDEAARMASTYPANFLKLERTHGRIAAGYRADLVALDADLGVHCTWIGGAA